MFGLTHAYISSKILNDINEEIIIGSIAPDLVWNDTLIKKQANIHVNARKFHSYIKNKYPEYLLFAKSVLLHSDSTSGVDLYSDDPKAGYAFRNGKHILKYIRKLFGLDDGQSADLSHNFVEAALDILLARDIPEFVKHFDHIVQGRSFRKYISIIAAYGSIPQIHIKKAFDELLHFYTRSDYTSIFETIQRSLIPIIVNRFNVLSPIEREVELILNQTIVFIKPTYNKEITHIVKSINNNTQLMSLLV